MTVGDDPPSSPSPLPRPRASYSTKQTNRHVSSRALPHGQKRRTTARPDENPQTSTADERATPLLPTTCGSHPPRSPHEPPHTSRHSTSGCPTSRPDSPVSVTGRVGNSPTALTDVVRQGVPWA